MKESEKLNVTFIIPLGILALIRIVLGVMLGIWFPAGQIWDDRLMVSYMSLSEHFKGPLYYSLVKDMGWPVLVNLFSRTRLPYAAFTGIFNIIF